jgi:hypothetical protein
MSSWLEPDWLGTGPRFQQECITIENMIRPLTVLIGAAAASASFAADLPVREVILYKNGVGYFERGGQLPAGASARLDFRPGEMNDVLKSLTIRDSSGGTVSGVRYDSAEPIDKKLAEFPFRLGQGQPLSALLDQVKGARIELQTGSNPVRGAVVGGRVLKGADGADREQALVLTDDGQIRAFDLAGVTGITFADPALQAQLKEYLASLTASRSRDKKSIYFDSANDKARNLSVSYLIPAPIWKTSYRLLFDPKGETTLEGWAIVDNTTGEDWTNVRLALVSGRPVSFVSQLYAPRYLARETVEDQDVAAVAPKRFEGGVVGGVPGLAEMQPIPRSALTQTIQVEAAPSNVAVATEAREIGELFEYRFSTPVTVKRNESAMLPFVQTKLGARKLLIWSSGVHPMNAAELTNSTGKTLDAGPITVFDSGSYAGEALMDLVKQSDKRLIGYALDQGTRVENRLDSEDAVEQEIRLTRGVLSIRSARRIVTTYTIKNVDAKEKKLIIEHPLRPETKVVGAQPSETTQTARRFEVALRPKSDEKFAVTEEQVLTETKGIANMTPDTLLVYRNSKAISDQGRRALEQIAAAKSAITQTDAQIRDADQQLNEINQDQTRLRENIRSLNGVAGQQEQVARYAKQLADQEARIASLRDQQAALRKQRQAQQNELNALVEKLSF